MEHSSNRLLAQVSVLGAGSWGTAVALHLARGGHPVLLWSQDANHIKKMQQERCNQRYLPNIAFPDLITPTNDLTACEKAAYLIVAVPSHAFTSVVSRLKKPKAGLAWLTKGIDPASNQLLSQTIAQTFGGDFPIVVISGPSFAKEVARALPTALVLASQNPHYRSTIRQLFHHNNVRVYVTDDVIGVQLAGAVKNVLAIACGISDGLQFGANAKAALITRGLAEMSRLGVALGAEKDTFMGLAGVGDLVLTCTDDQSRNRRFGLQLGQGIDIPTAEATIGQVVEGKYNAAEVAALAKQHHIDMPICTTVHALLQGKTTAKDAVLYLMGRPLSER